MPDLITAARAKLNIPSATTADDPTIDRLIGSCSRAIQRYCRRDFARTDYDELYSGNGEGRLLLRHYPVLSVQSVRYRPVTVLKVNNSDTSTNQQARVTVSGTGLTLVRVASGAKSTSTLLFAGNATLTALATAITALGNGWTAQVVGEYGSWPSADLRSPQGALTAWGQDAELKLHTVELAGYQVDERRGWLLRTIPYSDPELLHSEALVWPVGVNNLRVQYTAGYDNVPADVQEACAEWVAILFWQTKRDPGVSQESASGAFSRSYSLAQRALPPSIARLLAPYRQHPLAISGG
jgi:hypothetical protein